MQLSSKIYDAADFSAVQELDTINICVPTPLRKTKDPDMSFIVASCQEIAHYFHAGTLALCDRAWPHNSGGPGGGDARRNATGPRAARIAVGKAPL